MKMISILPIRRLIASWSIPVIAAALTPGTGRTEAQPHGGILTPDTFTHYVDGFNHDDEELYSQYISNEEAWPFLRENIPLFECPDKDI